MAIDNKTFIIIIHLANSITSTRSTHYYLVIHLHDWSRETFISYLIHQYFHQSYDIVTFGPQLFCKNILDLIWHVFHSVVFKYCFPCWLKSFLKYQVTVQTSHAPGSKKAPLESWVPRTWVWSPFKDFQNRRGNSCPWGKLSEIGRKIDGTSP